MLNRLASIYNNLVFKQMNSTQKALKEFEKIEGWVLFINNFFLILIFLIFLYYEKLNNSYSTVVFSILLILFILILFPIWLHFYDVVNNSYSEKKSFLKNINLHIGDKIDFIEEDGYRREGELTRISMTWFEFRYKNSSIHTMDWLAFKEKNYILVWTKHGGDGVEKVTVSRFLNPSDKIEEFKEKLKEKIKDDDSLKSLKISSKFHSKGNFTFNILVLSCSVEIVAGKRNHYEMLTKLNSLISNSMCEMKMYYYDGATRTFKNNYH